MSDPSSGFNTAWVGLGSSVTNAADKVGLLFLRSYVARATADSMRILRQSVDLAQPFLDERFARILFSLPSELRLDRSLQIELIRRNCPALLKIPDANLRAPLEAGPFRRWTAKSLQRVGGRLGLFRVDVPEKWLVARLDEFFLTLLLEDRSLDRPHIDADGMRELLSQTQRKRAQARDFFSRLATLELHLRSAAASTQRTS